MRTIKITQELKGFAENLYLNELTKIHDKLDEYITQKANKNIVVYGAVKLLKKSLPKLVLLSPKEQETFINDFEKEFSCIFESKVEIEKKEYTFNKWLENIFESSYNTFRNNFRTPIIQKVGVKACPYCNAQLTVALKREDKGDRATLQLDHYYPKAKYPYLAISFFNLIPCCGNCNNIKNADKTILGKNFHLYTEEEELAPFKFSFDPASRIKYYSAKNVDDIKIHLRDSIKGHHGNAAIHNKTFDIEQIYETQKDVAEELFAKKEVYTESYKKDLVELLGNTSSTVSIERFITGNYHLEEDIHKRPLAKYTQDIARDLGLIK